MKKETSLHRIYKNKVVRAARKLAFALEAAEQDDFDDHFSHGAAIRHDSHSLIECMAQYRVVTTHAL
jgi:hypothetical protein